MPICQLCGNHIIKRYRLTADKELFPLVNIPPKVLQQLHSKDLDVLKQTAEEGIMLCSSCKYLCLRNINECIMSTETGEIFDKKFIQNLIKQKKLDFRMLEDKKVIEDINKEKQRRENINKILIKTGKFTWPQVPKN